jgi:MerR family transcriptional regulator, light-induced transcriptional regulator
MPSLPPVDPGAAGAAQGAPTPEVFAGFLTDGDEELARWALELALRGRSRADTYDTFVREAMAIVGERWTSGRWTISEEHLATRTLMRVLASLAPEPTPVDRVAPVAALAGIAGEEHATGLMALDHVLREVGWATVDLGPNVPADDLVRFCAKWDARLVALSASLDERLPSLLDAVAAVRAQPVPPVVMVGGRIVETSEAARSAGDWAGASLRDAAHFASSVLERVMNEREGT